MAMEKIGMPPEAREEVVRELTRMAERLGVIAAEIQKAYGRESPVGQEAQKAAESVGFLRTDLEGMA